MLWLVSRQVGTSCDSGPGNTYVAIRQHNQQKKCNGTSNIFLHLYPSADLYPLVNVSLKHIVSLLNLSS